MIFGSPAVYGIFSIIPVRWSKWRIAACICIATCTFLASRFKSETRVPYESDPCMCALVFCSVCGFKFVITGAVGGVFSGVLVFKSTISGVFGV